MPIFRVGIPVSIRVRFPNHEEAIAWPCGEKMVVIGRQAPSFVAYGVEVKVVLAAIATGPSSAVAPVMDCRTQLPSTTLAPGPSERTNTRSAVVPLWFAIELRPRMAVAVSPSGPQVGDA